MKTRSRLKLTCRPQNSYKYDGSPRIFYQNIFKKMSDRKRCQCIKESLKNQGIINVRLRHSRSKYELYYIVIQYDGGNIKTLTARWDGLYSLLPIQ